MSYYDYDFSRVFLRDGDYNSSVGQLHRKLEKEIWFLLVEEQERRQKEKEDDERHDLELLNKLALAQDCLEKKPSPSQGKKGPDDPQLLKKANTSDVEREHDYAKVWKEWDGWSEGREK